MGSREDGLSIKVRWLSSSSVGCGTEMTKQTVTVVAGDPKSETNKMKEEKKTVLKK